MTRALSGRGSKTIRAKVRKGYAGLLVVLPFAFLLLQRRFGIMRDFAGQGWQRDCCASESKGSTALGLVGIVTNTDSLSLFSQR